MPGRSQHVKGVLSESEIDAFKFDVSVHNLVPWTRSQTFKTSPGNSLQVSAQSGSTAALIPLLPTPSARPLRLSLNLLFGPRFPFEWRLVGLAKERGELVGRWSTYTDSKRRGKRIFSRTAEGVPFVSFSFLLYVPLLLLPSLRPSSTALRRWRSALSPTDP